MRHNSRHPPAASSANVDGSGDAPLCCGVMLALTFAGLVTSYTVETPFALPSISRVKRVLAKVGSLVVIEEVIPSGSRRNIENSSGEDIGPGALLVVFSVNEMESP